MFYKFKKFKKCLTLESLSVFTSIINLSKLTIINMIQIEGSTSFNGKTPISASVWNPHSNGSILTTAYDTLVKGVDVRSLQ